MPKVIVDTNILIHYPNVLKENPEVDIIFLDCVLREIEQLMYKSKDNKLKYKLRKARNAVMDYVQTQDNVVCYSVSDYLKYSKEDYIDDVIVRMASLGNKNYPKDFLECDGVATNDVMLRLKLTSKGIKLFDLNGADDTGYYDNRYDPIVTITDSLENEQVLCDIYEGNNTDYLGMVEGQYIEITDANGVVKSQFKYEDSQLKRLKYEPLRTFTSGVIKPKNPRQAMAFDLLQSDRPIKFINGNQGSGKSFLMINHALHKLKTEDKRIVWIRPNIEVKGVDAGFLPGTINEKLKPYYMVLSDVLGSEYLLEDLLNQEKVVIEHLGYIRGRQFNNSIIICTEAQNLSYDQIKLIMGRVGYNTEIYFDGDMVQTDLHEGCTGFEALDKLKGTKLFGKVTLNEVERSEVAELSEALL